MVYNNIVLLSLVKIHWYYWFPTTQYAILTHQEGVQEDQAVEANQAAEASQAVEANQAAEASQAVEANQAAEASQASAESSQDRPTDLLDSPGVDGVHKVRSIYFLN